MHLVLEGGGVRSAFSAGVLKSFAEAGLAVDSIFATSTGSMNAAYFCAGQIDGALTVWRDHVAGKKIINYLRLFTPTATPGIDFDYMIDEVMGHIVPLDRQAATDGKPRLFLTATDINASATVVAEPDAHNLLTWVKASAAFPLGYNKVIPIDGLELMDGGMVCSVPFEPCMERINPEQKVVVVLTRPTSVRKGPATWWQRLIIPIMVPPHARDLTLNQHRRHNELMRRLEEARDSGRVILVEPPPGMPLKRLSRDRAKIIEGIDMGRQVGKNLASHLLK